MHTTVLLSLPWLVEGGLSADVLYDQERGVREGTDNNDNTERECVPLDSLHVGRSRVILVTQSALVLCRNEETESCVHSSMRTAGTLTNLIGNLLRPDIIWSVDEPVDHLVGYYQS
ncbi:hypothetical protein BD324DRAFT_634081 [Kockovaella imperatae]|uniref:Uncharacterized protein n=1 Tax=Kockovaella imperatae TaxID=4999 RepID=A0A1Y1UAW5_9TREE|nr:hypothetical protein BD324DRAFT_634081 [Kockovaella imperatae]ORX35159.1 hypothetical protein BD324DRAFT_634081 [Kockovaella imperatae]